jgi:7-keto-8-aminopelargonate synthetase-like enzyme
MGTFSKTFASIGGVVVGDRPIVSFIKHHARSLIFSAAATPASVASVLAILDMLETEPELRARLWIVTERMRTGLRAMGYDTGPSQTPIIPVIIGNDELCFRFWKELFDAGVYCNPVVSPAVPEGMALLRTSYMATHTRPQLEKVLGIFETAGRKLGII